MRRKLCLRVPGLLAKSIQLELGPSVGKYLVSLRITFGQEHHFDGAETDMMA
jgi:hypothetical protein